ncbi:DNA-binding transcriptional regulator, XRE family [Catalinimonas alkaloidigena]|uniref:DNA-binding transcriptional regulator, XRE family n=1 Tax=Catalinimonas alkaloidigena TaxID=1075417 RepID=A0A1G9B9P6_9BACT|nr:helix-turn-helix transcriptional regulator [Catalinimonas alkaloidigena]SDK36238.1 DNA-binding transcriptional regulator, XRE family [Catalinimonas alkaloidigena]
MAYDLRNNLLLILQKRGITIRELADRTGLSKKQISKIIRHGDGKLSKLELIAAALGVTLHELIGSPATIHQVAQQAGVNLAHSKNRDIAARYYPDRPFATAA